MTDSNEGQAEFVIGCLLVILMGFIITIIVIDNDLIWLLLLTLPLGLLTGIVFAEYSTKSGKAIRILNFGQRFP